MHVRDELNVRVGSGKRGKTVTQEVPVHTTPSVATSAKGHAKLTSDFPTRGEIGSKFYRPHKAGS